VFPNLVPDRSIYNYDRSFTVDEREESSLLKKCLDNRHRFYSGLKHFVQNFSRLLASP